MSRARYSFSYATYIINMLAVICEATFRILQMIGCVFQDTLFTAASFMQLYRY